MDTMLKLSRRVKQKPHPRVHMTRLQEDQASYKRHVSAGHIPYRRDCAVCLRGAARSRSKRTRIPTADSFALALDLAGPYEPGVCEDEEVAGRARRFLIGVYRFPTDEARSFRSYRKIGRPQLPRRLRPHRIGSYLLKYRTTVLQYLKTQQTTLSELEMGVCLTPGPSKPPFQSWK